MRPAGLTCEGDADHDDDDAHHDGDDAEQARQPAQPPGAVDVAALQAVSGLQTDRQTDSGRAGNSTQGVNTDQ